jgi:hypothetical protein
VVKALPNESNRACFSFKTAAAKNSSYIKYKCRLASADEKKETVNESKIIILEIRLIAEISLLKYLEKRHIPLNIAEKFCKETDFLIYGKTKTVIGFRDNAGGYELRSPHFKGSSSPKEVTFFEYNKEQVNVFEGFFSFLPIRQSIIPS